MGHWSASQFQEEGWNQNMPNSRSGKQEETERYFSIELKSKSSLKNVTLANGSAGGENVLVEGTLGKLERTGFADGAVLEIVGSKGILRINVKEKEIGSEVQMTSVGGASA